MTSVSNDDEAINRLASLPVDEQATALFDFVVDDAQWQAAQQADTDGRAR